MDEKQDLDTLMGYLGDFGKYQKIQFFLHILSALTAGVHMLSLVTVAAVPDHRCTISGIDTNTTLNNYTIPDMEKYIPRLKTGEFDSCHIYNETNITNIPCNSYVYDTTYYKSSRAMEWDFVCDKRWMGAIAQSSYMLGVFTGAVTLGTAADKYGRKVIFCWSALLQLLFGVMVAFAPEYYTFLLLRFLYGIFGSAGSYITGFVLTMELVGPSKRTVCGIAYQAVFAIGILLVAGWGAIISDRQVLQIIYGLHSVILLGNWWWMDESIRWLWSHGKASDAVKIVQKALKMNKSPIQINPTDYLSKLKLETDQEENAGMTDLFKTPNLRSKTLNICFAWFANSLVYYGLAFSTGKLRGNPYLILFINGVVELPSYLITVYLMDKTGRRPLISFYMIAGGIACIIAAELTPGSTETTTVVMLGKFLIASSFAIVYNYSAELFPTVIRNSALGLGSMCARLSATLTPLISLLDSFDPTLPSIIFSVIAMLSGCWILFLPETLGSPMPQSIEDGETFGVGDTCFSTYMGKKHRKRTPIVIKPEAAMEQMEPLNKER